MEQFAFDAALCRQCKGLCCQAHPGAWADPERFAALFLDGRPAAPDTLAERLRAFGFSFRDFSGIPVPAPQSTEGGCIFLTPQGCRLSEKERPDQCLALIPDLTTLIEGECHCRLPGKFTYGAVRRRWQKWWASLPP